jgi:RNA polymerase sigma-70 factor (ECF subfamily)
VRDAGEFDEFYRGTYDRILAYLYAAGGDLADAQDAAQEAYLRAWQHWGTLSGSDDPERWVRTVGWRSLATGWRRLRRRRSAYTRYGLTDPVPGVSEDSVALVVALRRLPAPQRHALVLFHIVGLPVTAIATETHVPVGTVKARLSRGRKALAALLGTTESETSHV